MAQLHVPKLHALHAPHIREPRLRLEFLGRAVYRGSDWYLWKFAKVSPGCALYPARLASEDDTLPSPFEYATTKWYIC